MAGGGDVRIIGGNKRVKDGVADVINRCLQVQVCGGSIVVSGEVTIKDMEQTTTEVLSESTNGRPIVLGTMPVTIHTVPANKTDKITLYCTNQNTFDLTLTLEWGTGGANLLFHLPAAETVPVVFEMPLTGGETVEASVDTANARIFGRVDRVE